MKDDLISRQAAIDAITAIDDGFNCVIYTNEVREILCELPSVPERKGRWIKHNDYLGWAYLCSECNHFLTIKYKYCPNCGANMEGAGK